MTFGVNEHTGVRFSVLFRSFHVSQELQSSVIVIVKGNHTVCSTCLTRTRYFKTFTVHWLCFIIHRQRWECFCPKGQTIKHADGFCFSSLIQPTAANVTFYWHTLGRFRCVIDLIESIFCYGSHTYGYVTLCTIKCLLIFADSLTCHFRAKTEECNNINDGSALIRSTKPWHWARIQPPLMLLFRRVPSPACQNALRPPLLCGLCFNGSFLIFFSRTCSPHFFMRKWPFCH